MVSPPLARPPVPLAGGHTFSGPNNREPIEVAEVMITTEANVRHGQIGGRHEDNSLIDAEGSLAGGAQRIQDWTGVLYACKHSPGEKRVGRHGACFNLRCPGK